MTLLLLNFEHFRYIGVIGLVLINAREIPDMLVSPLLMVDISTGKYSRSSRRGF
jgi:hypothetical protein